MASGVLRSVRELVVRDISTNTEWWRAYQLEARSERNVRRILSSGRGGDLTSIHLQVPVMALVLESGEKQLQRQSPRLSAERVVSLRRHNGEPQSIPLPTVQLTRQLAVPTCRAWRFKRR